MLRHGDSEDRGDQASITNSLVPAPLRVRKSLTGSTSKPYGQSSQLNSLPPSYPEKHSARERFPYNLPVPDPYESEAFSNLHHQRDNASSFARSARSFGASLKHFSITPSEMPYPSRFFVSGTQGDHDRTEQILGLRASKPPPLPPKPQCTVPTPPNRFHQLVIDEPEGYEPETAEIVQFPATDPQNGRTAWLHAAMAFFVVFNCWGINNCFGLFQAYFETSYLRHSSPGSISCIGSTQIALVFGMGVPVGRLIDKGYFKPIFRWGSFIVVAGLFISSWCNKLWSIWLVQGLITGIGMGMVFCSGTVALMTWFDETKIGVAMGLGAAGSCVGGIIYILLSRHFLFTLGYPTTMRILGGVVGVTIIPPNLVFRMRAQDLSSHDRATSSAFVWRSFASSSYFLAMGGMFFSFLGVYFGFVYMIDYAYTVLELDAIRSTNLLIYMFVANLPGRFLPALISDRCIGPLNMMIPSVYLSAAIVVLWISTKSLSGLTVVACFYGFTSAGIQVLYAPTVMAFCLEPAPIVHPTTPSNLENAPVVQDRQLIIDRMGVKAGGIFTAIGLACLIGTPIGGALITYRVKRGLPDIFAGAQVFALVSLAIGGSLLLASRLARIGLQAKRA
ncbi:Hypothetical protein R9X50_00468500 [Acrodontium crateriforme]|uniref:Uncharacterized protein n=1 Tax=Acrodontium crateriforme TaxID=150365 RepID=A0AAQ3RAB9_9PEZI|nr:Hypothetical protein R9X50_00468500 [Acrodontium crateriforme]